MEWETENLSGRLMITNGENEMIYHHRFKIPANEAIGPKAKRNILKAAGYDYPDIRCTKHSRTYYISSRIEPYMQFCFRRQAFHGIEYSITLKNDYSPSRIGFWPTAGSTEQTKEFPDFL